MVSKIEAEEILKKFKENKPTKFFNKVDENLAGMRFVLLFLYNNKENNIYASTLAEKMKISRSRVTTIVQKLLNKGFIEKDLSCKDARIEVLKITKKGEDEVEQGENRLIFLISTLIDEIGLEEIHNFLNTLQKIKHILEIVE